jgi:hypothetical protein
MVRTLKKERTGREPKEWQAWLAGALESRSWEVKKGEGEGASASASADEAEGVKGRTKPKPHSRRRQQRFGWCVELDWTRATSRPGQYGRG